MKRFMSVVAMVVVIGALMVAPVSAGRGDAPPVDPPVAPVQVDSICYERTPTPGVGFGWFADGCNTAYQTINFDGVTPYAFCLGGYGTQTLHLPGYWGCAVNTVPVTLTGDGSVSVCLTVHGRVDAPWSAACVQPATI